MGLTNSQSSRFRYYLWGEIRLIHPDQTVSRSADSGHKESVEEQNSCRNTDETRLRCMSDMGNTVSPMSSLLLSKFQSKPIVRAVNHSVGKGCWRKRMSRVMPGIGIPLGKPNGYKLCSTPKGGRLPAGSQR